MLLITRSPTNYIAVDFLLSHNYRMDAPFMRGITYLSWEEEALAREIAAADWSRDNFADIGIHKDDLENLQLMQQVRDDIANWMMRSAVSLLQLSFLPFNVAPYERSLSSKPPERIILQYWTKEGFLGYRGFWGMYVGSPYRRLPRARRFMSVDVLFKEMESSATGVC